MAGKRAAGLEGTGAGAPGLCYAIGDVHGRLDCLEALIGRILDDAAVHATTARPLLVTLGDYVDRGPDSAGVIDRLMAGIEGFDLVCLKGNHEAMFLEAMSGEAPLAWATWLRNGGAATLCSYGAPMSWTAPGPDWFRSHVPHTHQKWLRERPLHHRVGELLFVHAGVRPGVPLEAQSEEDLLWIRKTFYQNPDTLGLRVVHGHTPNEIPEIHPYRINLDTLAYATGVLSCAVLDPARPFDTPRLLQTAL
ncbi:MAG: serine/threonine protein phosphatase [Alphaproteobacteria bacterium]|nr:serine/threonine protein phosphatase [Alphaproteobacteria bacterium]